MANMYPDLNEESDKKKEGLADSSQYPQTTYQSTTAQQQKTRKKKKNPKEGDKCCVLGAKIWVSIIGVITAVLAVFVIAASLYAKFGNDQYAALSQTLPTGGVWMIFGFGLTLLACSVILILSACFYTNGCFKVILVAFSIVLAILLILEIASASALVWGLGVIALPDNSVGNSVTDALLAARNATTYATWHKCCIENTPPYSLFNTTDASSEVCLWPESADVLKQTCGTQNVLVCVCANGSTAYGADFGKFLQSRILWVGGVTIALALLLLFGLIATCVLICAKRKKSDAMYHSDNS